MSSRGRTALRHDTQVLLLQLAIVTLTTVIAFALFAEFNRERLGAQYGDHALDIARVVATAPIVLTNISRYDNEPVTDSAQMVRELADGPLQATVTRVMQRTGVLFVVIANNRGIRLAHPDRDKLGRRISTNPSVALSGREEWIRQSGTLGQAIVGKVPVLEPGTDRVLGMVSVGISTKEM